MGVAEATFYRWKKVYAEMGVSEIRRLKQLEDENTKLKRRPPADQRLEDRLNEEQPHSELGNLTPSTFAAQLKPARQVA